jgi:hypothetical protein
MIARTTGHVRSGFEPQPGNIEIVGEHIDHPDCAVFRDAFIQALWERRRLMAIFAFDEATHRLLLGPENVIESTQEFSHSLDPKRTFPVCSMQAHKSQ